MERNTLTTAGALQLGDRFYRQDDKAKKVYTLGYTTFVGKVLATPDLKRHGITIKKTTPVIFLRHKQD